MSTPAVSGVQRLKPALARPVASRYWPILVLAGCLLIWFLRRPQQVWHPYVWAEETFVVRHFLDGGWLEALRPVQGYVILPTTLLLPLAASVSFVHLPVLMSLLSAGVFALTVVILVVPESRWGSRSTKTLMAFAMVLCPVNPEVFGVLLYSFWWAALWPVIILGWKRDLWWARIPLLVVGALSSPAGAAMVVPFAVSWWWSRRRAELIGVAILAAGAIVQLVSVLGSDRRDTVSTSVGRGARASGDHARAVPFAVARAGRVEVGRLDAGGHRRRRGVDRGRRRVLACGPSDRAAAALAPGLDLHAAELRAVSVGDEPGWRRAAVLLPAFREPRVAAHQPPPQRTPFPLDAPASRACFWPRLRSASSRTSPVLRPRRPGGSTGVTSSNAAPTAPWCHVSVPIYSDGSTGDLWTLRMTPAECRARL